MSQLRSWTHVATTADQTRVGSEKTMAAPRTTRVAATVIMAGVLIQAILAGGFLAGRSELTPIHMMVGGALIVAALVLLGAGLVGRRSASEPRSVLINRVAVLLALLITAAAGMMAGDGARDLLMIHIPLALISMGLTSHFFYADASASRAEADQAQSAR